MAFLEELGKTITDKSREVVEKAKDLTEVLQLKSQISSERAKLNDAYTSIGKTYFKIHDDEVEKAYAEDFDAVRACLAKIEALEEEISVLEGVRICAECGAKVSKDSIYCGKCGAFMDKKQEPEEEQEPEQKQELPRVIALEDKQNPDSDAPAVDSEPTDTEAGEAVPTDSVSTGDAE